MSLRPRDYLDLLRPANVFTAPADVLAGYLFLGGSIDDWKSVATMALVSACLYAAGTALNDVCDHKRDAVERPLRPIPSGRVPLNAALLLIATLMIAATVASTLVSIRACAVTTLLILAIILYDWPLKTTPLAPAAMGACRALNLVLGMSIVSVNVDAAGTALGPIAIMWLYVTSLTFFARTEAGHTSRLRLILGTIGVCFAVAGLALIPPTPIYMPGAFALLATAIAASAAYYGSLAARNPAPQQVQRAVAHFVICMIPVDVCIAWTTSGPLVAAPIALLLIPTLLLRRRYRVT